MIPTILLAVSVLGAVWQLWLGSYAAAAVLAVPAAVLAWMRYKGASATASTGVLKALSREKYDTPEAAMAAVMEEME